MRTGLIIAVVAVAGCTLQAQPKPFVHLPDDDAITGVLEDRGRLFVTGGATHAPGPDTGGAFSVSTDGGALTALAKDPFAAAPVLAGSQLFWLVDTGAGGSAVHTVGSGGSVVGLAAGLPPLSGMVAAGGELWVTTFADSPGIDFFQLVCPPGGKLLELPLDGGAIVSRLKPEQFGGFILTKIETPAVFDDGGVYFFGELGLTLGDGGWPTPSDSGTGRFAGCVESPDLLIYAPLDGGRASVLAAVDSPFGLSPSTPIEDVDRFYFVEQLGDGGFDAFTVPKGPGVPVDSLRYAPAPTRLGPAGPSLVVGDAALSSVTIDARGVVAVLTLPKDGGATSRRTLEQTLPAGTTVGLTGEAIYGTLGADLYRLPLDAK